MTGEPEEFTGLLKALNIHLSQQYLQELSIGIFVIVYVMIIFEKLFHRTIAALIGAATIMVLGVMPPSVAWSSIDYNTIFLLFGMMNIVTVLAHSGFFNLVAYKILVRTGSNPVKLMMTFTTATAFFSAFLDNVTTILFMTPIIIRIAKVLELPTVPFVVALVLASNIGGTTTLIGDPPNLIIGSIAHKSFNDFLVYVAPHALAGFVAGVGLNLLYLRWSGVLKASQVKANISDLRDVIVCEVDRPLMKKGLIVFFATILLFVAGHSLYIEPGIIALFTSTILMFWSALSPAQILEKVEWTTLLFFIGLFIVVGSLEHTGVLSKLAQSLIGFIGSDPYKGIWIIGTFSAVISGFVDNIPFTMSMAYVLTDIAGAGSGLDYLWWALSLGACLGGNFTLIGASANIVAVAFAEKEGYHISFMTFMKYGAPVAFVSTLISLLSLHLYVFISR